MVKNLKYLRMKKNISQQKLAEMIGVSQQSINKYENHNIEPDIATLILLADYFNTSVDYLIGNTDINHKIQILEPYDLNSDETTLIDNYRKLTTTEKDSIKNIITIYLKQ